MLVKIQVKWRTLVLKAKLWYCLMDKAHLHKLQNEELEGYLFFYKVLKRYSGDAQSEHILTRKDYCIESEYESHDLKTFRKSVIILLH